MLAKLTGKNTWHFLLLFAHPAGAMLRPIHTLHSTSIERALTILEFLDGARRGWNISELSRKLNIPKSSTHVIVVTLERLGYLTREPGSRDYSLGLKVYGLGCGLMKNPMLPDLARPPMLNLVEHTRLTAHLAVLEKDQAIYIQKVDGPGLIKFDTYVGKRTNLHCTAVGKVLLAYAPEPRLQKVLLKRTFARYTNKTIISPVLLRKELARVRQLGYALDDEEEELEVRCLAAPVFNRPGECMAALGITGTAGQIRDDHIADLVLALKRAAAAVFGYAEKIADSARA